MGLIAGMRRRRKASYDAAERDRKVRSVDTSSWHYRVYAWWFYQKNHYRPVRRVNFCAYWRAVIFWAAGRGVRKIFPPAVALTVIIGLAAALVWGLIAHRTGTLQVLAGVGGGVYGIGCIIVAVTIIRWVVDENLDVGDVDSAGDWPEWAKAALFILCGLPAVPITIAFGVVLGALFVVVLALYFLFEELEVHKLLGRGLLWLAKLGIRVFDAHPRRLPWLRLWVLMPLITLGIYIWAGLQVGLNWMFLVSVIALGIFAGFAVFALIVYLAHKYDDLQQRRETERKRQLFATPGFMAWYRAAKADDRFRWTPAVTEDTTPMSLATSLSWASTIELLQAFLAGQQLGAREIRQLPKQLRPERPRRRHIEVPKAAMWVWRFLVGLGEFIALLWSGLVYIKRVRACPYLEFTSAPQAPATGTAD